MESFRHLVGRYVMTKSGKARIESVMGKYGTLSYSVGGIGWLDLTASITFAEN